MPSDIVRARIDPEVKREASAVLAGMGLSLSLSDAIRLMLVRVAAERALPFAVRLPNAATRDAMRAAARGEVVRFDSVEAMMDDLDD
jgi:DNA-damage-inducible protein J